MARKLTPHDYVLRVYLKTIQTFVNGEDRFKLIFARNGDIE